MLLSEVARTGRRFHRKSEPELWYRLNGKDIQFDCAEENCWTTLNPGFDAEQLVAADWESEPKKIEVTAADLLDAAKAISNMPIVHQRRFSPVEMMRMVIDELGLKEG